MKAYVYPSGVLVFAPRPPLGTLPVSEAPEKQLRAAVAPLVSYVFDGTMIVAGVAKAQKTSEKLTALLRFKGEVEKRLGRRKAARALRRAGVRPNVLRGYA